MSEAGNIPHHIAIIMDGNGRWAQERGENRSYGHIQGVESVRKIIKAARIKGIQYLTLYVFSTENWGRPAEEVDMLMELLCSSVVNEVDELKAEKVRVRIIGDRDKMSEKVIKHLDFIESETNTTDCVLTVILALNYSAKAEISRSARIIAEKVSSGELRVEDISQETISQTLYTNFAPDPDLIIRTGGECRLSNFLLWQGAYSELYFTDTYWPDFDAESLNKALDEYTRRERRFGLIAK